MNQYKLVNEDKKVGVWLSEDDLVHIIEIVGSRSAKYKKKLIDIYEYLEDKKYTKKKNINKIEND